MAIFKYLMVMIGFLTSVRTALAHTAVIITTRHGVIQNMSMMLQIAVSTLQWLTNKQQLDVT
jgi:hypothetical protein